MIRSRSAWLANLFTTDTALCFNDPNETAAELIEQYPHYHIGVSSSHLVTDFIRLNIEFPTAKWLYIERNAQEAKISLMRFTQGKLFGKDVDRILKEHAHYAVLVKNHPQTLTIDFADIDQRLCEAWQHLVTEPFQATRARLLSEFRIEQRLDVMLNRFMKKGTSCPSHG